MKIPTSIGPALRSQINGNTYYGLCFKLDITIYQNVKTKIEIHTFSNNLQ